MPNKIHKTKYIFKDNARSGYALLELIFYISLFAVLSIAVINSMIMMTKSLKETALQAEYAQSGTIMERMSREVRGAYGIGSIGSSDLLLNTKDSGGANKTVEFKLVGSNIELIENGTLTGNLNTPTITVDSLNFSEITTVKGSAVKMNLTVQSTNDLLGRTLDFYDTVVLRGDYK